MHILKVFKTLTPALSSAVLARKARRLANGRGNRANKLRLRLRGRRLLTQPPEQFHFEIALESLTREMLVYGEQGCRLAFRGNDLSANPCGAGCNGYPFVPYGRMPQSKTALSGKQNFFRAFYV